MPASRAQINQPMTDQKLIAEHMVPDSQHPGIGDARVAGYGVHVWALVGHLETVDGDISRVARDYCLPIEVVEAALAYYRQHREIIDARRAANAG